MNKWLIIFGLAIFIVEIFSFSANASIKPIIINDNQSVITTSNHTVTLRWYIVDDNPNCYEILENGQILQPNKTVSSNLILYNFSNIIGYYNLTLFVFDYSNYKTVSNTNIVIEAGTVNSGKEVGNGYTVTASTPGFTLGIFMVSVLIVSSIPIIKRKRKQNW